jgi:hypothetical protein
MSISWGPGWYGNSNKTLPEEEEKTYVEGMIKGSNAVRVQNYACSDSGGDVYVKNGRHTSNAERRVHVTLQLGFNREPWSNEAWPPYTAHVMDLKDFRDRFITDVFKGLTKDSTSKIEMQWGIGKKRRSK